jgi:hypothetical protein
VSYYLVEHPVLALRTRRAARRAAKAAPADAAAAA